MLRLRILILVLVLLPLQQSWAAMGPYCGDARIQAVLCCDHTDADMATVATTPNAADTALVSGHAAEDADCGSCHANGTAALFATSTLHFSAGLTHMADGALAGRRPVPAPRPERPQWRALV